MISNAETMGLAVSRMQKQTGALLLSVALCLSSPVLMAQEAGYTAVQAERGHGAYTQYCEVCHGPNLNDGRFGLTLKGVSFRGRWSGKPMLELFTLVRTTMPPAAPDSLGDSMYADLLAYIMQANDIAPGDRELPAGDTELATVTFPGKLLSSQERLRLYSLGVAENAELPPWPAPPNPLEQYSPVTDAMLADPPSQDWLTWRRTYDAKAFSPLKQITRDNVTELRTAWTLTLPPGPNTATPLVHDGVLFVHSYGDHVQALNAETGDELWHYARRLPQGTGPSVKRNMAIYGGKLFVGTSDLHVIALDVKTGSLVWDHAIESEERWGLTGGPLAAKGMILQGVGGQGAGGAFILGLDADTGEEVWRFHTVAQPGEPGGNSWNGLAREERSGGSVWTAGSYDPELNLAFFGPAPTYDTAPLKTPVGEPGVTNDALYTNTTIALNPKTGELVWHYQHLRNGQWDLDWAFERQIVEWPDALGKLTKYVVTGGKPGLYDVLEAATGRYVSSFDMGLQNLITAVDPETGEKSINEELIPGSGETIMVCPHTVGGRNWIPGAYNPNSGLAYVPAVEACMYMVPVQGDERGFLTTGVSVHVVPQPDSDGRYGRIQAIDVKSGETLWTARQRAPQTTGVLATAGGLVFAAALDRFLTAYDDRDGSVLWKTRLNDVPNSTPITYGVNGKQYVAMVVGHGAVQPSTFAALVPEVSLPVARSSSIWVFTLEGQ